MTTIVTVKTHSWRVELTKVHEGREPEVEIIPASSSREIAIHQQLQISVKELPLESDDLAAPE